MGDLNVQDNHYNYCTLPEEHRDHICHLMDRGMTAEIRQRTENPKFFCGNCGAVANAIEDLCNPRPLKDPG